jgi:anti-sigma-K factor RskA
VEPTQVDAAVSHSGGRVPRAMRMRQSLAQFEAAFRQEAQESVARREQLRRQAAQRSRFRRHQRVRKQGTLRFVLLSSAIVATSVLVTVAMFQTLALLVG